MTQIAVPVNEFERWAGFAAAIAAVVYGLSKRTPAGLFMAASAFPVAYRSFTGRWPGNGNGNGHGNRNGHNAHADLPRDDTQVALSGGRGIHVRESVRIERPVGEVYRFWSDLENLPRFLSHLESVTDSGNNYSHWIAKGPAGLRVEWDAEIINEISDCLIGWRSLPGSDVVTAGSVRFSPMPAGRVTQIDVHLQYAPPAGKAGAMIASLFGRDPSKMIQDDLGHLKRLFETSEVVR